MNILAAIFVSAAISFTITRTGIFTSFRELISSVHPKLEQLIWCPWCLNHYVVIIMLLTSDIELLEVSKYSIYNFLFTMFLIVGAAGILHYVLIRAYEPVIDTMLERELEKSRKKH